MLYLLTQGDGIGDPAAESSLPMGYAWWELAAYLLPLAVVIAFVPKRIWWARPLAGLWPVAFWCIAWLSGWP